MLTSGEKSVIRTVIIVVWENLVSFTRLITSHVNLFIAGYNELIQETQAASNDLFKSMQSLYETFAPKTKVIINFFLKIK